MVDALIPTCGFRRLMWRTAGNSRLWRCHTRCAVPRRWTSPVGCECDQCRQSRKSMVPPTSSSSQAWNNRKGIPLTKPSPLDLKCRLHHIRAHHRNRKTRHPPPIQKDLRRAHAQLCLLRGPRPHLDQPRLLHHRDIPRDFRVHAEGEDMEPHGSRSLHRCREQLHCRWGLECDFRLLDTDPSDGGHLESADAEDQEDRRRGRFRHRSLVSPRNPENSGKFQQVSRTDTVRRQCLCRQRSAPSLHRRPTLHLRRNILHHQSRPMEVRNLPPSLFQTPLFLSPPTTNN